MYQHTTTTINLEKARSIDATTKVNKSLLAIEVLLYTINHTNVALTKHEMQRAIEAEAVVQNNVDSLNSRILVDFQHWNKSYSILNNSLKYEREQRALAIATLFKNTIEIQHDLDRYKSFTDVTLAAVNSSLETKLLNEIKRATQAEQDVLVSHGVLNDKIVLLDSNLDAIKLLTWRNISILKQELVTQGNTLSASIIASENLLAGKISAEKDDRTYAINNLQANLNTEQNKLMDMLLSINAAQNSKFNTLQTLIKNNNASTQKILNIELSRALEAENVLSNKIILNKELFFSKILSLNTSMLAESNTRVYNQKLINIHILELERKINYSSVELYTSIDNYYKLLSIKIFNESNRAMAEEKTLYSNLTFVRGGMDNKIKQLNASLSGKIYDVRQHIVAVESARMDAENTLGQKIVNVSASLNNFQSKTLNLISAETARAEQGEMKLNLRVNHTYENLNNSISNAKKECMKRIQEETKIEKQRAVGIENSLAKRLLNIENMLLPLVDLVTNIITAVEIIAKQSPSKFVLNYTTLRLNLTGGAFPGEYISLIQYRNGSDDSNNVVRPYSCSGAVTNAVQIQSDNTANMPLKLTSTGYGINEFRVCHSRRRSFNDNDFWYQKVSLKLQFLHKAFESFIVHEAYNKVVVNSKITLLLTKAIQDQTVQTGDYLALVPEASIDCENIIFQSTVFSQNDMLYVTYGDVGSNVGPFLFCHAPSSSNGNKITDFVRQPMGPISIVSSSFNGIRPLHGSSEKIAANLAMTLKLYSSVSLSSRSNVALISATANGCQIGII
jgi:hypothetical protein